MKSPLREWTTPYGKLLSTLKNALGLNQILAPGRYLAPAPVESTEKRYATIG